MIKLQYFNAQEIDIGKRADQFLLKYLFPMSRAQIKKLFDDNKITKNNKIIKASIKVKLNDIICVAIIESKISQVLPENIALNIIYSDDYLAIINKPQGLLVHPGAGQKDGTLLNALLYHFPELQESDLDRPGIVHRLDKDSSGLMLIAKNKEVHGTLSALFKNREVKKVYRLFCHGIFDKTSFEIKSGHVRHPRHRLRFFTGLPAPLAAKSKVRFAHTAFRVLRSRAGMSEVKADLHTGRTHQIRAHLADIGHPLVGDLLYGGKALFDGQKGQALHAETLGFQHPISKTYMEFTAPLPDFMTALAALMTE
jgi:23S rRNA pseudouridine1911/1915/1917 synthase